MFVFKSLKRWFCFFIYLSFLFGLGVNNRLVIPFAFFCGFIPFLSWKGIKKDIKNRKLHYFLWFILSGIGLYYFFKTKTPGFSTDSFLQGFYMVAFFKILLQILEFLFSDGKGRGRGRRRGKRKPRKNGYIYVLESTNPRYRNLLKVGVTTKTTQQRIRRASRSSTYLYSNVIAVYEIRVSNLDPFYIEDMIHDYMKSRGKHYLITLPDGKTATEWFRYNNLQECIRDIRSATSRVPSHHLG